MTSDDPPELIPDRACGACTLCCKVFPIPETGKTDFGLCPHAREHLGCDIHLKRPDTCRQFFCIWRLDASLGDEWRPDVAGFVLHDPAPFALLISCDDENPDAWRREPYESQIREWAVDIQRRGLLMGARAGDKTKVLLRDREIDLNA